MRVDTTHSVPCHRVRLPVSRGLLYTLPRVHNRRRRRGGGAEVAVGRRWDTLPLPTLCLHAALELVVEAEAEVILDQVVQLPGGGDRGRAVGAASSSAQRQDDWGHAILEHTMARRSTREEMGSVRCGTHHRNPAVNTATPASLI